MNKGLINERLGKDNVYYEYYSYMSIYSNKILSIINW
jgi:hypothetical protein